MAGNKKNFQNWISKKKVVIAKWVFPSLLFLAIVGFLISSATKEVTGTIDDFLESRFEDASAYYATDFFDAMHCLREATSPIGALINEEDITDKDVIVSYLTALKMNASITDAWVVNDKGVGVNAYGSSVTVSDEIIKKAVSEQQKQIITTTYGTDNSLVIAYIYPLTKSKGAMISYYDPTIFLLDTSVFHFDTRTWYAVMDADGQILTLNAGNAKGISRDNNVLEDLNSQSTVLYDISFDKVKDNIKKKSVFSFRAYVNDMDRYYVFTPAGINDWYFVLAAPDAYVQNMRDKSRASVKNLGVYVIISLILFFAIVSVINILSKHQFKRQSKKLQEKADTDQLTELNNKMATERKIKEYIEENPDGQAMMFIFDIDNFKKINDTMGHAFGDEVLREIGMRLKSEFRMTDIMGRAGGDEFIILLKDIKTEELIGKEASRVANLFKNFKVGDYTKYSVTASIGCAIYPRDAEDFESLYKAADAGLYKAKKAGKNQLAFYQDREK